MKKAELVLSLDYNKEFLGNVKNEVLRLFGNEALFYPITEGSDKYVLVIPESTEFKIEEFAREIRKSPLNHIITMSVTELDLPGKNKEQESDAATDALTNRSDLMDEIVGLANSMMSSDTFTSLKEKASKGKEILGSSIDSLKTQLESLKENINENDGDECGYRNCRMEKEAANEPELPEETKEMLEEKFGSKSIESVTRIGNIGYMVEINPSQDKPLEKEAANDSDSKREFASKIVNAMFDNNPEIQEIQAEIEKIVADYKNSSTNENKRVSQAVNQLSELTGCSNDLNELDVDKQLEAHLHLKEGFSILFENHPGDQLNDKAISLLNEIKSFR